MSSTGQLIPRSVLRHRPIGSDMPAIPPWIKRASRTLTQPAVPHRCSPARQHLQASWVVVFSLSMGLTLILMLFGQSVIGWSMTLYDNWVYSTPRTFQTDAYVGHEGNSGIKSHFIVLNNQEQTEVIELPGNDTARARIYLGPLLSGPNAALVPATLRFVPNHSGQVDMLVQVQGTSMLFVNNHGTFQAASDDNNVASSR